VKHEGPVRVLIVDDQALMRRGLARLLTPEEGIEVVGVSEHGRAALDLLASCDEERLPHAALVDIHMPVMDGITLLKRLQESYPSIRPVVLTAFEEDEYLFEGLRSGARGYLLKDAEPEEVADVLRRVARGESVLTGAVADRLIKEVSSPRTPAAPLTPPDPSPLSAREFEVVGLISEGEANQGIARRLFITEGTVRNHVTNALRKLNLRDRTQLALWYGRHRA
jgi:DNA-binding NarL/FixJ family response regulator